MDTPSQALRASSPKGRAKGGSRGAAALYNLSLTLDATSPSRGASGETGDFVVLHYGLLLFPSAAKPHLPAKGPTIRGAVTAGDWGVEP